MNFLIRGIKESDAQQVLDLAKQFSLLNLPPDKKIIKEKIERSINSFADVLGKEKAEYMFVIEDVETKQVVGSSTIMAKHGTEESPHLFFKIETKNRFSEDLGIGFIHKVLRFCEEPDGPSEIGALLVDRSYRRRPEKLGKQVSLIRFVFMGMQPERFENRVLCELTPPLTEDGRSEFWEALGRRFTGLPYQEADLLSQKNKEFITSLFPESEIYLCLLDTKARLVLGRVGETTLPAQHLLEKIGFSYLNEVDPFDGGPHFGVQVKDITIIKNGMKLTVVESEKVNFRQIGLVGCYKNKKFVGGQTAYDRQDDQVYLPERAMKIMGLSPGDTVFVSPIE